MLLCEIRPAHAAVDPWLWVVVGDLPPAYLVTDDAGSAADALACYVTEMRRWIVAARVGEPSADLIPVSTTGGAVDISADPGPAEQLERRLDFLETEFLKGHS